MKKILAICLVICLLLSGCSTLFDGSYVSITPHEGSGKTPDNQTVSVQNYSQLYSALQTIIRSGRESSLIFVQEYNQSVVEWDMLSAVQKLTVSDPITTYAVEDIQFELGTNAGQKALAVNIQYVHGKAELQRINQVANMDDAKKVVLSELEKCSSGVVLYVEKYEAADIAQWVEDHALSYPELVMESPEVTVNLYPEEGSERVVELKFTYQNSRDSLRTMQQKVSPMFASAKLYVSGEGQPREKFSQLYAFLMERFEQYTLETSSTPAYSLLIHGVGDAKAFASVYSAMCRQAGLDCAVVAGTRGGKAWFWNIIAVDGAFYHVDLLRCSQTGSFKMHTDGQMSGYVWDYSAIPAFVAQ